MADDRNEGLKLFYKSDIKKPVNTDVLLDKIIKNYTSVMAVDTQNINKMIIESKKRSEGALYVLPTDIIEYIAKMIIINSKKEYDKYVENNLEQDNYGTCLFINGSRKNITEILDLSLLDKFRRLTTGVADTLNNMNFKSLLECIFVFANDNKNIYLNSPRLFKSFDISVVFNSMKDYIHHSSRFNTATTLSIKNCSELTFLSKIVNLKSYSNLKSFVIENCNNLNSFTIMHDYAVLEILANNFNLQKIVIDNNTGINIDIIKLLNFKYLKYLKLSNIDMTDLTILHSMKNLEELYLSSCISLNTLDGIQVLNKLKVLYISTSTVRDISMLSFLKLKKIYLLYCVPSSVSCLENIESLEELYLSFPNSHVIELSTENLGHIKKIILTGKGIKYIKFVNLNTEHINISETLVNSIKNLTHAKKIIARHCKNIRSLTKLRNSPNVNVLDLYRCLNLRNISGLKDMRFITELNVSYCQIANFSYISKLSNLEILIIEGTSISNFDFLFEFDILLKLQTIDASNCYKLSNVNNLELLSCMKEGSLYNIDLSRCYSLENVKPLSKIYKVNLADCHKITDVSSLRTVYELNLSYIDAKLDCSMLYKNPYSKNKYPYNKTMYNYGIKYKV